MNSVFAARLTKLRRERGMSQKDAAKMLGVSQSLLSHYEKGIRECSLDFVCRASNFFDVSCDYLLGQVDTRRSLSEEFDMTDTVQDGEYRTSTLFRASVMLNDSMINCGSPEKLKDYFALSIYRMAVWLYSEKVDIARLRDKSGLRQRADDGYNKGTDGRGKSGIAKEYRRTEMRKNRCGAFGKADTQKSCRVSGGKEPRMSFSLF